MPLLESAAREIELVVQILNSYDIYGDSEGNQRHPAPWRRRPSQMKNREGEHLMDTGQMNKTLIPLTKNMLTKIRIRAVRRGIWFRVLNRIERASVDLTIKVVEKVRSSVLTEMLTSIIKRLLEAMENKVALMMKEVGSSLAQKLSRIAQKWGNRSAVKWKTDLGFIRYLTVMNVNSSAMFRKTVHHS